MRPPSRGFLLFKLRYFSFVLSHPPMPLESNTNKLLPDSYHSISLWFLNKVMEYKYETERTIAEY